MRILHLISSGGMYGAEAVILNISDALRRQGHHSEILSFGNASTQLHERALAEGLSSGLLPCRGQLDLVAINQIQRASEDARVDVVHAHGYKADLYAWAAMRKGQLPLISTCHTWYDNDLAVRTYGILDRWVLRAFARVVAVSADVEQQLLRSGITPERIRRIRNGIDFRRYAAFSDERANATPKGRLRVGLVGRLAPEKGVDIFVKAAALVARIEPTVEFVVIGDGPERTRLQSLVDDLQLSTRLQLLHHQSEMPSTYGGLDILVSASRQEGLPMALLEGMASGLAVVATTVGDIPTAIEDCKSGLLIAPGDPAALASAIVDLLRDEQRRRLLGRNAMERVRSEFSVERTTLDYLAVYQEAIRQAPL